MRTGAERGTRKKRKEGQGRKVLGRLGAAGMRTTEIMQPSPRHRRSSKDQSDRDQPDVHSEATNWAITNLRIGDSLGYVRARDRTCGGARGEDETAFECER